MKPSAPRPVDWQRALAALVVGLAVGLAAVAPHGPEPGLPGSLFGALIAEGARHPDAPAHFEGSEVEFHAGCEACLLQLQARSVLSRPAVAPVALAHRGDVGAGADVAGSRATLPRRPGRAPPTPSTFG